MYRRKNKDWSAKEERLTPKNRKMKPWLFVVISLTTFFALIWMHEMMHVTIFEHYEVESEIQWFSHFPDVVTMPEGPCPTDSCLLAHEINDIVGWPLTLLFAFFLVLKFDYYVERS